jgi:hypothetical protein
MLRRGVAVNDARLELLLASGDFVVYAPRYGTGTGTGSAPRRTRSVKRPRYLQRPRTIGLKDPATRHNINFLPARH